MKEHLKSMTLAEVSQVLKELGIHTCAESNTRPKGEPYVLY